MHAMTFASHPKQNAAFKKMQEFRFVIILIWKFRDPESVELTTEQMMSVKLFLSQIGRAQGHLRCQPHIIKQLKWH